jgi:uncharacterized protein (DUF433 family)
MDEIAATFTPQQAERLTGVSARRLAYWHRQGLVIPQWDDESRWLGYRRLYSFRDLVALRTLQLLRDQHNVSLQVLRAVNRELQQHYEEPWSSLRFAVQGNRVMFFDPETGLLRDGTRPAQTAWTFALAPVIDDLRGKVSALRSRRQDQIGKIEHNKDVMGGADVLAGTRIPTSAIWDWHQDGADVERILRAYPSLQAADIEEAIAHEQAAHECRP